jgi:hypothetical protein
MRKRFTNPKTAGNATAAVIILGTAFVTAGLLWSAQKMHPLADDVLSVILLYTTFAARGLPPFQFCCENDFALKEQTPPRARSPGDHHMPQASCTPAPCGRPAAASTTQVINWSACSATLR